MFSLSLANRVLRDVSQMNGYLTFNWKVSWWLVVDWEQLGFHTAFLCSYYGTFLCDAAKPPYFGVTNCGLVLVKKMGTGCRDKEQP